VKIDCSIDWGKADKNDNTAIIVGEYGNIEICEN
jgi:hypothetical protein